MSLLEFSGHVCFFPAKTESEEMTGARAPVDGLHFLTMDCARGSYSLMFIFSSFLFLFYLIQSWIGNVGLLACDWLDNFLVFLYLIHPCPIDTRCVHVTFFLSDGNKRK